MFTEKEKNALQPPSHEETEAILDQIDKLSDQFDNDAELRERFENNFYLYLFHEMRHHDG